MIDDMHQSTSGPKEPSLLIYHHHTGAGYQRQKSEAS